LNRFAWLLVLVILVCGAWSVGWLVAAGNARAAIAGLATQDGETSPQLTCESLDISGFPFRFDVSCTGATMVSGDITATIAGIRASVLAYSPTHAILSAQSPATLADAFTGSRSRIDFASAEASARLTTEDVWSGLQGRGWRLARASLVAGDVSWTDTLAGEHLIAHSAQLETHLLDMPELHDPAQGQSGLAIYARLADVDAPGFAVAEGEASLEAELTRLPDDLRAFGDPELLRRWADADGQLRIVSLRGEAGEEFIESEGTLALDSAARPEGQIKLTSKGLVERTGTLVPEEWQGLVLGAPAEDGSYSQTLNLRGGFVFAGLIPVAQLEPIL
jgi:hypothetical protein